MSKKVTIITDASKLDAHIVATNKAAGVLEGMIQLGLASAVYQAVHGRNTNHINAVALATGKGVRKAAIGDWLTTHAPVVAETDREKAKTHPFRFSADKLAELLPKVENAKAVTAEEATEYAESLMSKLWTEHKPDALVPETWDFKAALKKLLAQKTAYEKKGTKVQGAELAAGIAAWLPADDNAIQGV